jgi:hypothetical protein
MKNKNNSFLVGKNNRKGNSNLPGYPLYPSKEDIYNNAREETNLNPEDLTKTNCKTDM